MLRSSTQPLLRSAPRILSQRAAPQLATRRFFTTAPPHKLSRSWKSSAARWALAIVGVYWYNTSTVFAETPQHVQPPSAFPPAEAESDALPTIEELSAARRARLAAAAAAASSPSNSTSDAATATPGGATDVEEEGAEKADQQGAFDPETGEINWDCPCLGGMAHGPCGEEFRSAFSCFVYSKEEPKGIDCVDRFQGMQECFRAHPDIYGEELADAEDDEGRVPMDGEAEAEAEAAPAGEEVGESAPAKATVGSPTGEEQVPKARHDPIVDDDPSKETKA